MLNQEQLQNIAGVVGTANSILIMFAKTASFDQVACATGLFLALEQAGKNVSLLSPELVGEDFAILSGSDRVQTKLGRKHLHIIFDYQAESVDKVSYHINEETNKFHLVIQPQKGFSPLESESVSFDYAGADADLIILVGVNDLEDLDQLYFGYQSLFTDSATISLNNFVSEVANINVDFSSLSCMSEGVVEVIESLGLDLGGEVATNLLAGIEEKTESFHSLTTSPNTFEVAAKLLKAGARRIKRAKSQPQIFASPVKEDKQNFVEVMKRQNKPENRNQKLEARSQKSENDGTDSSIGAPSNSVGRRNDEGSKSKNKEQSPKNKTKQKGDDLVKPGDLEYQPTGFGQGGAG